MNKYLEEGFTTSRLFFDDRLVDYEILAVSQH